MNMDNTETTPFRHKIFLNQELDPTAGGSVLSQSDTVSRETCVYRRDGGEENRSRSHLGERSSIRRARIQVWGKGQQTMSGDWKIKSARMTDREAVLAAVTAGFSTAFGPTEKDYVVENVETGEERHVTAYDREQVGSKISKGQFSDD